MITPYYHNERMTLYQGDVRAVLAEMAAESVQMCVTSPPYWALRSYLNNGHDSKHLEIGSESTPDEYVQTMVDVFRGVWRVLRRDGTAWVNLGDSYAQAGGSNRTEKEVEDWAKKKAEGKFYGGVASWGARGDRAANTAVGGLKPKDLCMLPARVALALQADGRWLRSVIIWSKPNPMPESVTDRPTTAHEYIYLLSKSDRYFYDADAIREPHLEASVQRYTHGFDRDKHDGSGFVRSDAYQRVYGNEAGRNKRSVWEVPTAPLPMAHFATYPPALIEPCVLAGTSEKGCCPECGAPWGRVVERTPSPFKDTRTPGEHTATGNGKISGAKMQEWIDAHPPVTKGWQPTCKHGHADTVPCVVLDPFSGAGTSGLVALRHNRRYVGIDLSSDYLQMSVKRIEGDAQAQQMHMDLTA